MRKPFVLVLTLISFNLSAQSDFEDLHSENVMNYVQFIETESKPYRFNSFLKREIQTIEYKNEECLLVIQNYFTPKGIDVDSSILRKKDLKPIAYHTNISTIGYREVVEFDEDSIINSIIYSDSSNFTRRPNNESFIGVALNEIIGSRKLKGGMQFSIEAVNPGLRYFEYTISIKVLGTEFVYLTPNNKIECWKLEVYHSHLKKTTIEWYSVDNQLQLRSEMDLGNKMRFVRKLTLG